MRGAFPSAREAFAFYPTAQQADTWWDRLLAKADTLSVCTAFCDNMPVCISFGNGPNV